MESGRSKDISRVTLAGSGINLLLVAFKFAAGIWGRSSAMIADAVHSLSDLLTDIIVLVFVKIGAKPADKDHPYGHGKFETLATLIIGLSLIVVGALLLHNGIEKITRAIHGGTIETPGLIALAGALISIALKEFIFRLTIRVGKRLNSTAVMANAWHHRTDALSSVATGIGIGAAIALGPKWAILDPIAATLVSILILVAAAKLLVSALNELLEKRLPQSVEKRITEIIAQDPELREIHHLRTRSVGSIYSIEMHVRMHGDTKLLDAHHHTLIAEKRLREAFGPDTIITIHVEPLKVNGAYDRTSQPTGRMNN